MFRNIGLNKSTLALGALLLEKFVREGRTPQQGLNEIVEDVQNLIGWGDRPVEFDPRKWSESTVAIGVAAAGLLMGGTVTTNTAIGLAAGSPEFAMGSMAGPGTRLFGGSPRKALGRARSYGRYRFGRAREQFRGRRRFRRAPRVRTRY